MPIGNVCGALFDNHCRAKLLVHYRLYPQAVPDFGIAWFDHAVCYLIAPLQA